MAHTAELIRVAARQVKPGDVLAHNSATVNFVDTATTWGVVYVEVDYTYRLTYNHGDPVAVYRAEVKA